MKIPIPIHLPIGTKILRIHRDVFNHRWLLWTGANKDFTEGTTITLHDDGSMRRVYHHPTGYEEVLGTIKRLDFEEV